MIQHGTWSGVLKYRVFVGKPGGPGMEHLLPWEFRTTYQPGLWTPNKCRWTSFSSYLGHLAHSSAAELQVSRLSPDPSALRQWPRLPKLAHGDPSQGPLTAGGSPGARTLRAPESKMHGRSCTKGLTGSCFRHDVVFGALCVSGAFRSFRFSWLCWCDVSFRILRVMVYPPNIDGFWFRAWH